MSKLQGANGADELGDLAPYYYLDGSAFGDTLNDTVDLLWFRDIIGTEPSQIPPGALILDAKLIYTTGPDVNAVTDGPFLIGALSQPVDELATYESLDLLNTENLPATRASRALVTSEAYAGFADIGALEEVSADLTHLVQAWVDGIPNYGVTVYANDTNNGWQVNTIGNENVSLRPRLEVTYTLEPVKNFAFIATQSAYINSNQAPVDGATLNVEFLDLDTSEIREALLLFGNLFGESSSHLHPNDQIVAAYLTLHTAGQPEYSLDADTDDPYTVHQILVPWDLSQNFGPEGLTEAKTQIAPKTAELIGMGENTRISVDITPIVRNWKAGQPNYGIDLRPVSEDGWQFFWPGATADLVPTLHILAVEVSGTPIAGFTSSATQGIPPFEIELDASQSVDPDGGNLTFNWDLGDGSTATGILVQHTYANPGTYTIRLVVTDDEGETAESITSVKALGNPVAILNTAIRSGPAPLTFIADSTGSYDTDGGAVTVLWNLGNQQTSSDIKIKHTFTQPGSYPVQLTITDDEGSSQTLTHTVNVLTTSLQTRHFQQGVNGYTDTFQKRVSLGGIAELGEQVEAYYLDGRPQDAAEAPNDTVDLIRFNQIFGDQPHQIPPQATIIQAELTYYTGADAFANTDGPFVIGQLLQEVNPETLYSDLDIHTDFPEDRGPRGVVDRRLLAGFADISLLEIVTADITPYLQAWQQGEPNYGMAVFTDDTANGWEVKTIGNSDPNVRPRLSVTYTTCPTTTLQLSPIQSAIVDFGADTLDGAFVSQFFLDGGTDLAEGLFKFDDLFNSDTPLIPSTQRILSAKLMVQTGGVYSGTSVNADTDDPFFVHQMLIPWDPADPTINFGDNGITTGVEGSYPITEFIGMGEQAIAFADVTAILYNWQNGDPNHGLGISPGGTDGWQIY